MAAVAPKLLNNTVALALVQTLLKSERITMPRLRILALALLLPSALFAHGLDVFASTDCETLFVEAKFSNGAAMQTGTVEVRGGDNELLTTLEVNDGRAEMPMAELDHSGGLLVMIDGEGHNDFWILTPADIARQCAG